MRATTGGVARPPHVDAQALHTLSNCEQLRLCRVGLEAADLDCAQLGKWKDTLHETINDEIVRMAREGRPVTVTLSEWPGDTATAGRLESSVQSLPGVNSINRRLDSGTLVFELKYVGDAAFLQEMLQETMRSILSHEQMDLLQLESQGNDSVAFAFVQ